MPDLSTDAIEAVIERVGQSRPACDYAWNMPVVPAASGRNAAAIIRGLVAREDTLSKECDHWMSEANRLRLLVASADERVKAERERCARVADEHAENAWAIGEREGQNGVCSSGRNHGARAIAAAIRGEG